MAFSYPVAILVYLFVPANITFGLKISLKCEGDLAATSVTPLIARVDWLIWMATQVSPFLPHGSMYIPPGAVSSGEEDGLPQQERALFRSRVYEKLFCPARPSKQALKVHS